MRKQSDAKGLLLFFFSSLLVCACHSIERVPGLIRGRLIAADVVVAVLGSHGYCRWGVRVRLYICIFALALDAQSILIRPCTPT